MGRNRARFMSQISPKVLSRLLTKALFVLLMFLNSSCLFASGLAERVQQTYKHTQSFRADFVQKTKVEILDREIEEQGELVFSTPGRFLIHYRGDRERKYISDGKTLWIYRPKDKEVEVYKNAGDLLSREALIFLGGLGEMTREFQVTEKKGDELLLVPKKKDSLFQKLILSIDLKTFLVKKAVLFPKGGNRSFYFFSSIHLNESMPESIFSFHQREGRTHTLP